MNKRNSKNKFGGEILLMHNNLMNKLASLEARQKPTDELGFLCSGPEIQHDSLTNLINKGKNIVQANKHKIEGAKRHSKNVLSATNKKQDLGTFLTGVGLIRETMEEKPTSIKKIEEDHSKLQENFIEKENEETDPNEILKELIKKHENDDLSELRKMIKKTGESLEDYSKQFNKSKREILQLADRYMPEMDRNTLNRMNSYKQFDAKRLESLTFEDAMKKQLMSK